MLVGSGLGNGIILLFGWLMFPAPSHQTFTRQTAPVTLDYEYDHEQELDDFGKIYYGTLYAENDRSESEALLRTILIHNAIYDRRRQPLPNDSDFLNVTLSISLLSLMDIDDDRGSVTLNAELGFKWFDWRLKWKPETYSNITEIPVRDDDIYHPEIVLVNGMDVKHGKMLANSMAILYSDGKVLWYPRATLKVPCYVDLQYWPFTAMECDVKLGTPEFVREVALSLHTDSIYLKLYVQNLRWQLVKGGQYMVPESHAYLREIYGNGLPWIRLYFQRRTNNFYVALLLAPVAALVLSVLFFICTSDPNTNFIAGLLELIFFSGVHIALLRIMPTSTSLPSFALFIACGELLILGFLLSIPLTEFVKSRKSRPHPYLIVPARFFMQCQFRPRKKETMTFNNDHDKPLDYSTDWRLIASFFKFLIVLIYGTVLTAIITKSLEPLLDKPADRWALSFSHLHRMRKAMDRAVDV